MSKITKYLNNLIVGNVFDSPEILNAYSTDASALKITPKMVAIPESTRDIRKLMTFFTELAKKDIDVPIAIRGSGLDEMGADLTNGVVISMEKLNHLQEIDTREKLVRVQAGITLKELNTALQVSGLTIPIKANDNETIGSLIANCPTDNYAAKYGGIVRYVERAEIVLANGECVQTGRNSLKSLIKKAPDGTLEKSIFESLEKISKENTKELEELKSASVTSAGYSTIAYAIKKDTVDILPLLFSSEGTLGIITEVILHAEVIAPTPVRMVATFSSLKATLNFLINAASLKPLELNLVDLRLLKQTEEYGKNLDKITKNLENGYAVFVSFNDKPIKSNKKIKAAIKFVPKTSSYITDNTNDNADIIDEFENSIASFLNMPGGEHVPVLSNFYIPAKSIIGFMKDITVLEDKLKLEMFPYGSFLTSNYSLRPRVKMNSPKAKQQIAALLKAGNLIITRNNGTIAGGLPEGRIKALMSNLDFTESEKKLYKEIKKTFDPDKILNPEVKLGATEANVFKHLRTTQTPNVVL